VSSRLEDLPRQLLDYISVAPNPRATIYSNWHEAQSARTEDKHSTRRATMAALGELRILREVLVMMLLNHPNIAKLLEFAVSDHHWYLFFEYVSGGQMLDYIIARGRLKEHVARKFVRGIVSALDYTHRSSIVHRDLKIENVLVSKSGRVKIIDYGLSNMYSPDAFLKTFCGSLYFAAPELLSSREYIGPELDVWSLGVIVYVLVVGKVPFDSTSMTELQSKIKSGQVEYPAWLSSQCKHFLSRLLVVDPQQRASMYEIRHHAWITKDFGAPPDDCVPARVPLASMRPEELDSTVLANMRGFGYGSKPDEILSHLLEEITEKVTSAGEMQEIAGLLIPYGQGLADSVGQSIYWLVKEKLDREQAERNSLARSVSSINSRSSSHGEYTFDSQESPNIATPSHLLTSQSPMGASSLAVPMHIVVRAHSLPLPKFQGLPYPSSSDLGSQRASPTAEAATSIPRIVVPDGSDLDSPILDSDSSDADPELAWESKGSVSVNMGQASKPHALQRSKSATLPSFVDDRFQTPTSPYQAARGEDRMSRSRTKESGISKALKRLTISKSPSPLNPPSPTASHTRTVSASTSPTMSPQFGQTLTVPGHVPTWQSDASSYGSTAYSDTEPKPVNYGTDAPRADQRIKTVSLKGLFSVANTTSLAPTEIRNRLLHTMQVSNVKWQETWGGFDLDWSSSVMRTSMSAFGLGLERVLEGTVVSSPQPASPSVPRMEYFDLSAGSLQRTSSLVSQAAPVSRRPSQTIRAGGKAVKFEVRIVKLPWMPGGKTHGVVFHRIHGDGLQYRQICSKMLDQLQL